MKKQKYTYSIYGFLVVIFLLHFVLVDASPNVSSQITFQEGEFSIGDTSTRTKCNRKITTKKP
jgi:hypothetical protein